MLFILSVVFYNVMLSVVILIVVILSAVNAGCHVFYCHAVCRLCWAWRFLLFYWASLIIVLSIVYAGCHIFMLNIVVLSVVAPTNGLAYYGQKELWHWPWYEWSSESWKNIDTKRGRLLFKSSKLIKIKIAIIMNK